MKIKKQDYNISTKMIGLFFGFILFLSFDLWFDFHEGVSSKHLIVELILFFLSLLGYIYYWSIKYNYEQNIESKIKSLNTKLEQRNTELNHLNKQVKSYIEEFREDISKTFIQWKFTKSEADVAGLLLKGMSLKEIAEVRNSNENTVRSQCSSIYKKSNLANRSQLSSYFLDDLV